MYIAFTNIKDKFITMITELKLRSMLTLTYPPENYRKEDKSVIKEDLQKFILFLRKDKKDLEYVYSYEYNAKGIIHIHILIKDDYAKEELGKYNRYK